MLSVFNSILSFFTHTQTHRPTPTLASQRRATSVLSISSLKLITFGGLSPLLLLLATTTSSWRGGGEEEEEGNAVPPLPSTTPPSLALVIELCTGERPMSSTLCWFVTVVFGGGRDERAALCSNCLLILRNSMRYGILGVFV